MAENAAKNSLETVSRKSRQFQPGDLAVYPAHGVGRIESIENREIGGEFQDFFIMKILENNMVIMIPTKNITTVGLRDVINKSEIKNVYKVMQTKRKKTAENQTWNRRYREYMDKIKSGSLYDVAEVFRDLFSLKLSKGLSFGERKLLDTAQGLLLKELCTARDQEESVIMTEIESLFELQTELT